MSDFESVKSGNAKKLHDNKSQFLATFGINLFQFFHPITGFDVVGFDDWLKEHVENYEDGKTSMKAFISKKYGKSAVNLIERLL